MASCNFTYRKAKESDDFAAVAGLVHLTDPYIYPTVCQAPDDPFFYGLLLRCLADKTNIFALNNLFLALDGERPIGILCAIKCGKKATFLDNLLLTDGEKVRLAKANEGYFLPLIEESAAFEGHNVTNLCVDPAFRGKGVGEGLLRFYLESVKGDTVHLDVIAANGGAVRLYQRCGFVLDKEYNGFSGTEEPLLCYHMIRKGQ